MSVNFVTAWLQPGLACFVLRQHSSKCVSLILIYNIGKRSRSDHDKITVGSRPDHGRVTVESRSDHGRIAVRSRLRKIFSACIQIHLFIPMAHTSWSAKIICVLWSTCDPQVIWLFLHLCCLSFWTRLKQNDLRSSAKRKISEWKI
jgi:hypothetical protein